MTKKVRLAEAKATFSAIVDDVANGSERYLIERRGRPVAAVVRIADLEHLESEAANNNRARGALALAGMWGDISDTELEDFVADVYAARAADTGREVDLEE